MKRSDWNRYWARSRGGRFTKASWSKRRILALLDPYLTPGARVLDAGCGSGFFSAVFVEKGCRVTVLDLAEEALDLAREATGGRADAYIQEDLLDAAFGARHGEAFDLIFSDGLFEHFLPENQERIAGNMVASLGPGGRVATLVPNALSPWRLIRPLVMPGIFEVPLRRGRLREIHRALEIEREGGLNVLPFGPSPERILGPRFGMLLYLIGRKKEGAS
ncbi:MAG: class I SAM-dependent methyltransferase [Candidatus Eisenbacteria bacterium]